MTWRTVVIKNKAKLEYRLGYLLVRDVDSTKEIFLKEVSNIIIETTAVSLTAALLNECIKNKIKVIFCDEKRNPAAELLPYYGAVDTSRKISEQINWDLEIKSLVWAEIIKEKIRNQADLLHHYGYIENTRLYDYADQVLPGDLNNMEATAARVYFQKLFGTKFTRDTPNSINAALNYGYAIILSAVNREIVSTGHITQIGIAHKNTYNCFNLGSDIMEPLRPLVDKKVIDTELKKFEWEEKSQLIDLINTKVKIQGKKQYLNNAIGIYTRSVIKALSENKVEELKFIEL